MNARTPRLSRAHGPLFHAGKLARCRGGLVRLPWLRAARVTFSREAARAGRRDALPRGAGRPVTLLLEREPDRAASRGELDDTRGSPRRNRGLCPVPRRGVPGRVRIARPLAGDRARVGVFARCGHRQSLDGAGQGQSRSAHVVGRRVPTRSGSRARDRRGSVAGSAAVARVRTGRSVHHAQGGQGNRRSAPGPRRPVSGNPV